MKINNNISAVITNKQLLRTEDSLSATMQRLSSGLKINHSKDDPSGMAISGKMHTQIDGLGRAAKNANDGVSVIQTADGALNEVTSMLQRMRELSVQAANELNSMEERQAIQKEINSLRKEIDRVSTDTEFNTKPLLDGSLDTRVYGDNFSRMYVSDSVTAGKYKITIEEAAVQAEISGAAVSTDISGATTITPGSATILKTAPAITSEQAGAIKINGVGIVITEGMTGVQVYEALRRGAEEAAVEISDPDQPLTIKSEFYGQGSQLEISCPNEELRAYLGLSIPTKQVLVPTLDADGLPLKDGTGKIVMHEETQPAAAIGKDAKVTLSYENLTDPSNPVFGFGKKATVSVDGNRYTITDTNGFKMDFKVTAKFDKTTDTRTDPDVKGVIEIEVTDMGPMTLQIGANESQNMKVRIPSISSEDMYLDDIDVQKAGGPDRAMVILDKAIARVSEIRSDMGANQNRLESTVKSLEDTDENMNSAVSRIEDADMAAEMTDYTKFNVLQQAATSVLSQANEIPQMALQLLGK